MTTDEKHPATDQEQVDAEAVLRLVSEGKPVICPALRRRIEERAGIVRQRMLKMHGATDIAAELTDRDGERLAGWVESPQRDDPDRHCPVRGIW